MLALPGAVFLYNGEELGLADVDLPDEVLQDPTWERSGHTERGRDGAGCRCPGRATRPRSGSRNSSDTWLPMPAYWATLTVGEADVPTPIRLCRSSSGSSNYAERRAEFDGEGDRLAARANRCLVFRRPAAAWYAR